MYGDDSGLRWYDMTHDKIEKHGVVFDDLENVTLVFWGDDFGESQEEKDTSKQRQNKLTILWYRFQIWQCCQYRFKNHNNMIGNLAPSIKAHLCFLQFLFIFTLK